MTRKIVYLFLILALVLSLSTSVLAQGNEAVAAKLAPAAQVSKSANGVYIVRMVDEPVVAYEGTIKGLKATKPGAGEKIDPLSPAVVNYVSYLTNKHYQALSKVGGQLVYNYSYTFNGFAATMSLAQATKLASVSGVMSVSGDELVTVDTSTTPDFLGLTAEGGLWDMGYNGEDVIIGVVDSGIWPESMSFSDRTGTNRNGIDSKLSFHQIPGWHGKCTPGEDFNASMCNQKLIGAQFFNASWGGDAGIDADRPWEFNSPRDYNGHGTHTSSTAGGNGGVPAEAEGIPLGNISGMAPRARIAMYKALWSNEDGSQASGFTGDLVAAIDQAVADGVDVINYSISGSTSSLLTSVGVSFLYAADAGVFVAASAGNNGPGASTVAHNNPWLTTVAAGTHDRYYEGIVHLGDGSQYSGASIDARGAGPAPLIYAGDAGDALCAIGSLDPALVTGKIVVCDRGIYARVDKSYAVMQAGGIGMVLANVTPSSINADLHYVPTVHVDHIDGAIIRAYAQTAGATATLEGGLYMRIEAPTVASFSSRGPALATADLLKPDIMAPGVDILAAVAPPGNNGRNFDFYSGTSMSSPHIAGIAALIIQAHPNWTPMMVKSALMTTASTLDNMDAPIPGTPFGYGAGEVTPNSAVDPGLVYDAGWVDWLGFLCGTGQLQASYCPAIGIDPSDLNYPSIAIGALAGTQSVVRTVTNVGPAATYAVSVDPPAGVDVTVDPATLTLAKGESASYTVTFTANAASVVDAWTFGSLTWTHGPHVVTSPIAIMPVAIAAPDAVFGSGAAGSLSFDVTFGYTGAYSAAPHGMIAPTFSSGTIGQDPDQTYPSSDDSTVGVQKWNFAISGAAYMRFSLVIPGPDDIDLFLEDSGGHIIASSTNGGTNEQIDVALPSDDTYTLVVHGWAVPSAPLAYSVSSWVVPLTPGGSLAVDSAPASAAVATTGTIDISWSGLGAGASYLGAVSHSGPSGLVGLTLVEVDVP